MQKADNWLTGGRNSGIWYQRRGKKSYLCTAVINRVEITFSEDLRGSAHGLLSLSLRQITLGSMWCGHNFFKLSEC